MAGRQHGTGRRTVLRKLTAMLALPAGLAIAAEAVAADSVWNHNGSQMLWQADGEVRVISYLVPRPGLPVEPGTVLFEGRRVGARLEGIARTFRQGCPPAEYAVAGEIASETHVVLTGAAPVRARTGCAIVGYSQSSPNAVLEFTYLRSGSAPVPGGIGAGTAAPAGEGDGEEPEGDEPGYRATILLIPGGHQIAVHEELNVASHIMPDMVNAVLTCRSGVSHILTSGGKLNVCQLTDARVDAAAGALVLGYTSYNPDTGVCDATEARYSYTGLCN